MANAYAESGGVISPKSYINGGIVLLILGILGIIFPEIASGVVVYLIAALLVIGGISFLIMGIKSTAGKWGGIALGIVLLIIGVLMGIYPIHALVGLTVMMGSFFIIAGVVSFLLAYSLRPTKGWWTPIISGVLSLILGVLVFLNWNSTVLVGLFVGIELLFQGITLIMIGKLAKIE